MQPPTLELPVVSPIRKAGDEDEMRIVRLAREIAMQLRDLPDILKSHGVPQTEFEKLKAHPYFVSVLTSELAAWEAAGNTHDRVKLKSAALIEEWLPELYASMSDRKEALSSRVKAAELAAKLAGMGVYDAKLEGASADRVQITINMGADRKLEINKGMVPKVLDNDDPLNVFSASPAGDNIRPNGAARVFAGQEDNALQSNMGSPPEVTPASNPQGNPPTQLKEHSFRQSTFMARTNAVKALV
jgi:hypothetical protein